jgi:hypothetical protein
MRKLVIYGIAYPTFLYLIIVNIIARPTLRRANEVRRMGTSQNSDGNPSLNITCTLITMVFRMENSMQAKWILVFFVLLFAYGAVGGTAHAELGRIDAAIDGQSQYAGKAYFFEGDQYIRYDWATDKVDPGYPKSIAEWNLPGGFTGGFDTVLNGGGPYSGKVYFFKGDQYVRYDWAADKADPGYPKLISGNWDRIIVD